MYKLTDSEIQFLLNQDRLTKIECIALLTEGYEDITILKDYGNPDRSLKLQGYKDILSQKEPVPKNPQHLKIYNKILEISETMERSMETTLFPVEDVYEYSVIDAPDPTFHTYHFLKWAKNKGLLPAHLEKFRKKDSESSSYFGNCRPTPDQDPSEIISGALTKGWEPEKGLLTRVSQEDELAIWNKWIKPIVDLHYNGAVEYIYFKAPKKLSYDEFEKMWELSVAPLLCSGKLPGIKIPTSMSPTEVEDRIMNYIWEPDLFLSEVLFPLKAGRGHQFVDSFLRCLVSIIDGKDLPAFLAYIEQGESEHKIPEIKPSSLRNRNVWTPSDVKTEDPEILINTEQNILEVQQEKERSLSSDFQRVIDECHDDVGLFWNCLKRKAKDQNGSMNYIGRDALYDLAKEIYHSQKMHFRELDMGDIDNKDFYVPNTDRKRTIVGNILRQIISRKCPRALSSIEIKTSIESLHNLFRSKQPFKSR